MNLQDFQKREIRLLRDKYPVLRGYLDEEIAYCFSLYCEQYHAASWTDVNSDEFIGWATHSPLDLAKNKK